MNWIPARERSAAAVPDAVDPLHDLARGRGGGGLLLQLLGPVGRPAGGRVGDGGEGLMSGDITL